MSTELIWQTVTADSSDTEKLGLLLGQMLSGGEILELSADLGGGKTTFVRGLAAGLKSKDQVSSPTFTLQQIYKADKLELHHFDFYRLDDPGVVVDQLNESLDNPQAITVVEWAKTVEHALPDNRLTIEFNATATSPNERQITTRYPQSYTGKIEKLRNRWEKA